MNEKVEISVFDSQPQIASSLYPEFNFHRLLALPPTNSGGIRRKLNKVFHLIRVAIAIEALRRSWEQFAGMVVPSSTYESLKDYQACELVISTGGTYLVEKYSLRTRFFEFYAARRFGKPLVLFTQSVGPFLRRRNQRSIRKVVESADAIFLRDPRSAEHLHEIGASGANVEVVPDVVFSLADPEVLMGAQRRDIPQAPRIAISVREWRYFQQDSADGMERYLSSIACLTEELVRKYRARIVFISTCQGVEGYRYDDSIIARQVYSRLRADVLDSVEVDEDFHDPRDLRDRLSTFDLVVATRMHMGILSLTAGVPVFPIAYEFKTVELFERLGLAEHVQMIDDMTPTNVLEGFRRFWAVLPRCRKNLFERVLQLHVSARIPGEFLRLKHACQPHPEC